MGRRYVNQFGQALCKRGQCHARRLDGYDTCEAHTLAELLESLIESTDVLTERVRRVLEEAA